MQRGADFQQLARERVEDLKELTTMVYTRWDSLAHPECKTIIQYIKATADVNGVLGNQWMGTGCLTAQRVHPLEGQAPGIFAGDLGIGLEACVALINAPACAVFDQGSRRWAAAFARGCVAMCCAAE